MNEAVNIGMSIMDTYFEKLDPKQAKSADSDQDDDDDDEATATASTANTSSVDMFIYETKDPYVLRSLPYLIGSQAFLDNDHVGLKDLDSEDEEDEMDADDESYEEPTPAPAHHDDDDNEHYSDEDTSFIPGQSSTRKKSTSVSSSSSTASSNGLFNKPKPTSTALKVCFHSCVNHHTETKVKLTISILC